MPSPVKISDRLLALAREEAQVTHRSATAQIEHWATLGRAVEAIVGYGDVLTLKRAGQALPLPPLVRREEMHDVLTRLVEDGERESVKARIRRAGTPVYVTDPGRPGMVLEVQPDRNRTLLHARRRRVAPAGRKAATKRK